jgi:hypothetical protein
MLLLKRKLKIKEQKMDIKLNDEHWRFNDPVFIVSCGRSLL